jgi:hypothetical protein
MRVCTCVAVFATQTSFNRTGLAYLALQRGRGLFDYINSTGSYGIYWRSKSYAEDGTLSRITKGGVTATSGLPGLNVVAFRDNGYVGPR